MTPPDPRSRPGPKDPATDQNPRSHKSYPQDNPTEQGDKGNPVHELLDRLIGLQVAGGCDDCTAYQTVERVAAGVYINHVWHDDTCPWIRHQGATP